MVTWHTKDQMSCFLECGRSAACVAVMMNSETSECGLINQTPNLDNLETQEHSITNEWDYYIREKFACTDGGKMFTYPYWCLSLHSFILPPVCDSCASAYQSGLTTSGLYLLGLSDASTITIFMGYCDMTSGGQQWLDYNHQAQDGAAGGQHFARESDETGAKERLIRYAAVEWWAYGRRCWGGCCFICSGGRKAIWWLLHWSASAMRRNARRFHRIHY